MNLLELFRTWFAPPRHLILLILAAWLGLALAERRSARLGIARESLNNLIFYCILAFVLGGRLVFAAAHISAFAANPLSLVYPNPDLFDTWGGAAAAILTGVIFGQRQKMPLWSTLDALVPFFSTVAIGIGLMHLAAGTAFGKPSSLPWAIQLWNDQRHPSQIYEILFALAILMVTWFLKNRYLPGLLFLLFVSLSAAARLFLEAFRGDSVLVFGGFRQAQLGAWVVLVVCFFLFEAVCNRARPGVPPETDEEES